MSMPNPTTPDPPLPGSAPSVSAEPAAPPSTAYRSLSGSGYRVEGNMVMTIRRAMSRLWLGPDHLLCTERSGFTEDYKRFYYRDIQAIIVRRTPRARIQNLVLGILVFCCLGGVAATGEVGHWMWGILAGTLGVFLLANLLQGPSCVTHLKTAVQLEELPAWRRLWHANRGIPMLRVRILAAQGELTTEETGARVDALMTQEIQASPVRAGQTATLHATSLKHYTGQAHKILFVALIVEGLISLARIWLNSLPLVIVDAVVATASTGLIIFALIRQYETDLKPEIKQLMWGVAVLGGVQMVAAYVTQIVFGMSHPGTIRSEWDVWTSIAAQNPLTYGWYFWMLLIRGILTVGLGTIGWLLRPGPAEASEEPLPPSNSSSTPVIEPSAPAADRKVSPAAPVPESEPPKTS